MRFISWIRRNEVKTVILAIFAYVVVLSAACIWKYGIFAYNGIDLAYFNQVFWNTVHGHPFRQTIHPHLSLGDHAELIVPLLAPLYAVFADPRTLLVLQSAALGAAAWPLWLIARRRLSKGALIPTLAFAYAWLANPSVQNINLFEFHILPFALIPLFFALLNYDKNSKRLFLLFAVLALAAREDVALVVAAIGLVAWVERRSWWWRIVPVVLGGAWFVAAQKLIAHFSPGGNYKFRVYYEWLGATPLEMLTSVVAHPFTLLTHVATIPNLEMLLGFLMPLAFLPLLAPKRLILAIGPLAQILLGEPGGGSLVLYTHYATLFLPGLFLAAIDGSHRLPHIARTAFQNAARPLDHLTPRPLLFVLFAVAVMYSSVMLGPLPAAVKRMAYPTPADKSRAESARAIIKRIRPDEAVAASYALLPHLSSREKLYSLHYIFLGVTQFAERPYPAPEFTAAALDTDDPLFYRAQFLHTRWSAPYFKDGFARLSSALPGPAEFSSGRLTLYRSGNGKVSLNPGANDTKNAVAIDGIRSLILLPAAE